MKFDTKEKDAEVIGDIKSNAVSIDTSNINFIVTILSTNLYSKPIESFIRETVSNAWDSHVEAGVNEPVILELGKDTEDNYYCRVQDFGVGLSPERFNAIYKNIGSSTKRDSNNQIGGFGIGRFSALAYSDVVHITSIFDGNKYQYMMYKDGNSISIDLLHEETTIERNGVSVQIQLKDKTEIPNFYSAIKKQLVYFENVYFIDKTETDYIKKDEFNNFHIKKYNDFLVNSLDSNSRVIDLVLGKVRYPLRLEALDAKYPKYVYNYPISLKFEIGDLEVTPNREEILYSQKNIQSIESVLDRAIDDIDVIFKAHSHKDFSTINEYITAIKNPNSAPLLEKDGEALVYIKIPSAELKITLNGQSFDKQNFVKLHDYIMTINEIPYAYSLDYGKLNYVNGVTSINVLKTYFSDYYLCDVSSLNNMSKIYIREKFGSSSKFIHINKPIKYYIKKYLKNIDTQCKNKYAYTPLQWDGDAVKVILKSVLKNLKNLKKFSDKDVPKKYIDDKKAEAKAKRALYKNAGIDWSQNINIDELRVSDRGYMQVTSDTKTHKLSDVKKSYTKLTVFSEKGDEKLRTLFNVLLNVSNVNFVEIAPTRMKLVKDLQNFVNIEDFMSVKYKLIRQIGTAKLIHETLPYLSDLKKVSKSLGKVSVKLQTLVNDLHAYKKCYLGDRPSDTEKKLIDEIYQLCIDKNYFDENMRATLNNNITMLKEAEKILLFVDSSGYNGDNIPDTRINLIVDYILARRLFRPDIPAVFKMKKETVLNIKEDENN